MEDGKIFRAKMYIDASYEGDLMAGAKVSYFVGRESNSTYGETLDGIRAQTPKHQFTVAVDPYVLPGHPASGLLPLIQNEPSGTVGEGDKSVQAYNFRLCLTQNPTNKIPIDPPAHYDPAQYELLAVTSRRWWAAGKTPHLRQLMDIEPMPNGKTDVNNNGPFSTDFMGRTIIIQRPTARNARASGRRTKITPAAFCVFWRTTRASPPLCARNAVLGPL